MAGKTLDLDGILSVDNLACHLANQYTEWETKRQAKVKDWEEIQRYIFATDTTTTSNNKLPWKNKTTLPKMTQIRDNLFANYMAAVFPKRKWLSWESHDKSSSQYQKIRAARAYVSNWIDQPEFKDVVRRWALDYIDYGNIFGTVEWADDRQILSSGLKTGYAGPRAVRISPLDIVFNPIAASFSGTTKFVRSLVTIGELKGMLNSLSTPEIDAQKVFNYMIQLRESVHQHLGTFNSKNDFFKIAGFDDYLGYLKSSYVELITCYGDFYDTNNDKFYKNHVIVIADRHKLISILPHESTLGSVPIHHCGWRIRQDNLWAQGPLDNLVGMQYRIDHLENLKADVFDLIAAPPLKIKGLVEEFEWKPFARIMVGDDGDVEVLAPQVNALSANLDIVNLQNQMEEMAGSPKEAAGFRTPGEKTAFEVQKLENAANRIFLTKIVQFEEFLERILNDGLELARRKVDQDILVRTIDDSTGVGVEAFMEITPTDLSANGRIKPIAARNFAEKAERVQNMTQFFASAIGMDPDIKAHFSSIKLAHMMEDLLDLQDYELIMPYIRISEQAEAQQMMNAGEEQTVMSAAEPAGLTPEDVSL